MNSCWLCHFPHFENHIMLASWYFGSLWFYYWFSTSWTQTAPENENKFFTKIVFLLFFKANKISGWLDGWHSKQNCFNSKYFSFCLLQNNQNGKKPSFRFEQCLRSLQWTLKLCMYSVQPLNLNLLLFNIVLDGCTMLTTHSFSCRID